MKYGTRYEDGPLGDPHGVWTDAQREALTQLLADLDTAESERSALRDDIGDERQRADRAEDEAEADRSALVAAETATLAARDDLEAALRVVMAADRHARDAGPMAFVVNALRALPTHVLYAARRAT